MKLTMAVGLVCLIAAVPQSQRGDQPPTFSSGVHLLTVQAWVTGSDGKPLRDLTPSQLTARVDGKSRRIAFVRFFGEQTNVTPSPSPSTGFVASGSFRQGRNIIIVVDERTLSNWRFHRILESAAAFIEALPAGDAAAYVGLTGDTFDLTNDHNALARKLRGLIASTRTFESWARYVPWTNDTPTKLATARELVARLARLRTPTFVVWIAGYLPAFNELSYASALADLGRRASTAGLGWSTVYSRSRNVNAEMDASFMGTDVGRMKARAEAYRNMDAGLRTLSAAAHGTFHQVDDPDLALAAVAPEIDRACEIAIEVERSFDDTRSHSIEVSATGRGISIRARRESVSVPAAMMTELLLEQADLTQLPAAISSYVLRGPSDGSLKLFVAVQPGSGAAPPVDWTAIVAPASGAAVVVRPTEKSAGVQFLTADVPPGPCVLTVAAIDSVGRAAVLHVPFRAELHEFGAVRASDLIVGTGRSAPLKPAATVRREAGLSAAAELYADDPLDLETADVRLELVPAGGGPAVASTPMHIDERAQGTMLSLSGALDTSNVAPGDYVANLILWSGGAPIGRVTRAISVAPEVEKSKHEH